MDNTKIEQIIQDCKSMASDTTFNLDGGFGKTVDHKRYADLLESLLRKFLPKVENE